MAASSSQSCASSGKCTRMCGPLKAFALLLLSGNSSPSGVYILWVCLGMWKEVLCFGNIVRIGQALKYAGFRGDLKGKGTHTGKSGQSVSFSILEEYRKVAQPHTSSVSLLGLGMIVDPLGGRVNNYACTLLDVIECCLERAL